MKIFRNILSRRRVVEAGGEYIQQKKQERGHVTMATFTVRGKNIEITPSLKDYVEKRVGKITKYFDDVGEISVLLTVSKGRHIVEVTVPIPGGVLLRGEEATMDMYTSIDLVVEKLERQIRKQKTRLAKRFRGGGAADGSYSRAGGGRRIPAREDEALCCEADGCAGGDHADEPPEPQLLRFPQC